MTPADPLIVDVEQGGLVTLIDRNPDTPARVAVTEEGGDRRYRVPRDGAVRIIINGTYAVGVQSSPGAPPPAGTCQTCGCDPGRAVTEPFVCAVCEALATGRFGLDTAGGCHE